VHFGGGRWRPSVVGALCLVEQLKAPPVGFRNQPPGWCEAIRWAVLDMSGPYQVAYDRVLPHACQVADPFHVVRGEPLC